MSDHEKDTVLPYHFVPVGAERRGDLPAAEVLAGRHEGVLHHKFVAGRAAGRIVCRLTTVTPTVLGGERQARDGQAALVKPFLLDGQPAIPASSLRGMVSAVAEAAANSALRVLDDRVYSFRKEARHALRQLGEVFVETTAQGRKTYSLRPLGRTFAIAGRDSNDQPLTTWRRDRPRYYGLDVGRTRKGDRPRPWEEIEKLPQRQRQRFRCGIVRVLGGPGRDLPEDRQYEIFVPYDDRDGKSRLRIPPQVVSRFYELADERTEAAPEREGPDLPYEPVGTDRNPDATRSHFRLKDGDLIFYKKRHGEVVEMALSAIWRQRVEDRDGKPRRAWRFFEAMDPDLVPFHQGRTEGQLTLAEQVFGFVSADDAVDEAQGVPALASRVRFGFGRLAGDAAEPWLEPSTLPILASPKPPSPNLYFSDFSHPGAAIAKHELEPRRHRPHGRKFYVHQRWDPASDPETWPWHRRDDRDPAESKSRWKMKSQVQPLRHRLSFLFHVDFDNLSQAELGLVLYALRPTDDFRHKLGMGKSVGLGSVQVDVLGLFEVDRQERYRRPGLFAPRYGRAWAGAGVSELGERYRHEVQAARHRAEDPEHLARLREDWRDKMDPGVRRALERLGEESFEPGEVSVPLVTGDEAEVETFRWFVVNDRAAVEDRQCLEPIGDDDWPRLRRHRVRTAHRGRGES